MNRYIVNVAVNGAHYCRIELPETIETDALKKARFLELTLIEAIEGDVTHVDVTMTRWNDVGTMVDIEV